MNVAELNLLRTSKCLTTVILLGYEVKHDVFLSTLYYFYQQNVEYFVLNIFNELSLIKHFGHYSGQLVWRNIVWITEMSIF